MGPLDSKFYDNEETVAYRGLFFCVVPTGNGLTIMQEPLGEQFTKLGRIEEQVKMVACPRNHLYLLDQPVAQSGGFVAF